MIARGPGLAAAVGMAGGGALVASQLPKDLHISGIPVSIVLGSVAGTLAPG